MAERAVAKTLGIMQATYERDKFSKVVQYAYKYYAWKAESEGFKSDAARYNKIQSTLSMARKLVRLGYPLEDLVKVFRAITQIKGPLNVDTVLNILRGVANIIYFSVDNVYWVQKMDMATLGDINVINKLRIGFWLVAVLLSLPSVIKAFLAARAAAKQDDEKSQTALANQQANVVRVAGDLIVSASFAVQVGVIPPVIPVHDGVIGLSGVVSGIAGLYMSWLQPAK